MHKKIWLMTAVTLQSPNSAVNVKIHVSHNPPTAGSFFISQSTGTNKGPADVNSVRIRWLSGFVHAVKLLWEQKY